MAGNGEAGPGPVSLEDKVDALLEGLAEIQDIIQYIPEISDTMQQLLEQQEGILDALRTLGLDENPGLSVKRYDS